MKMKQIILIYILLCLMGTGLAQAQQTLTPVGGGQTLRDQYGNQIDPSTQPDNLNDSTNVDVQSLPPKLYMWQVEGELGERHVMPADTASVPHMLRRMCAVSDGERNS